MQKKEIWLDAYSLLSFVPEFFDTERAVTYFNQLKNELDWQKEKIKIFGKEYWQPRLLAWYGDAEASYRYSGIEHQPMAWNPLLLALKNSVENFSGVKFNSVLANFYRDGQDSMGWHSDDEPELGQNPIIASLSFGATRRFCLRPRKGIEGASQVLLLSSGSLLLMQEQMQSRWQHSIPKTAKDCGARINLTFRCIEKNRSYKFK